MPWVPVYGTLCQTVVTIIPQTTAAGQLILKADPRRLYLEWWGQGMNNSMGAIVPGPYPAAMSGAANMTAPQVWKFKDCPSVVTGEWYSAGAPFNGWVCIQVLFVG